MSPGLAAVGGRGGSETCIDQKGVGHWELAIDSWWFVIFHAWWEARVLAFNDRVPDLLVLSGERDLAA